MLSTVEKAELQSAGRALDLGDALFEASSDCLKVITLDGRLARINANGLCALEIEEPDAILGAEWALLWPETHQAQARQSVREAALGGVVRFQGFRPTASGASRWWDVTVSPLRGSDGQPCAVLSVSRDITELAAARQAILVVDSDGVITSWNDAAQAIFGWSAADAIGRCMASLIVPERLRDRHMAGMKRFVATGESALMGKMLELAALRRTGEEFPIELVLSGVPGANGWAMMASIQDISARKAQTELFENAFQHAPIAQALVSLEGRFLRLNRAFCSLVDYDETTLLATDFQTITHEEDLEKDLKLLGQLVGGKISDYQMEKRYVRRDGRVVWVNLSVSVVRHPDGAPKYFIAQVQDLTKRREAEGRYRLLADNVSDVVGIHDLMGRCVYISPSCQRVLGYAPEEMMGRTPFEFMPADAHEGLRATHARLAVESSGTAITHLMQMVRKDGKLIWVEVSGRLVMDEHDSPVVVAITRDVTDRVESELRYRLMAENTTDMIVTTSLEGHATFVSPSSEAVTGWSPGEMLGQRPTDFAHPEDVPLLQNAFRRVAGGAEGARVRWRGKHKRGDRWVWLESSPSLLRAGAGHTSAQYLDVIRDVTAQVAQEEALARATEAAKAAAAAKAEFLANMSHEIRTPLTAVLGFAGLLSMRDDLTGQSRHFADRIGSASRGLLAIVNDVLDFSKLEAGHFEIKPRPVLAVEAIRDAVMMFKTQADEKGLDLSLTTKVDPDLSVLVDPERVRQILLNLIGNAVKFTDAGQVSVRLAHRRGRLSIEVRDTGAGLNAEQQKKLFQRFSQVDGTSTRKHGGTGLGLAICKGLVDAMGGRIGVRSQPGQGASFYFVIEAPLAHQYAAESQVAAFSDVEGVRVLVADDNPVNRQLVRAILEGLGAEVVEAVDGADAVGCATSTPFDVILMDVRMPVLDGRDALQRIRREGGPNVAVPVIAFSAGADREAEAAFGFDGFISKPIEAARLVDTVACAAFGTLTRQVEETVCA